MDSTRPFVVALGLRRECEEWCRGCGLGLSPLSHVLWGSGLNGGAPGRILTADGGRDPAGTELQPAGAGARRRRPGDEEQDTRPIAI